MSTTMTAEQRIKRQILINCDLHAEDGRRIEITAENVDKLFEEADGDGWWLKDAKQQFRCSGQGTNIPAPYDRHFESKSVARQLDDGAWVGWTYWYGGGKHGKPEEIDWMEDAYDLEVVETKTVVVNVFRKAGGA